MASPLAAKFGIFLPGTGTGKEGDEAAQALAAAVDISVVDARMILVSRLPRRVASAATASEAADRVLSLKGAGFDAFAASFESLRVRPPRARTARLVDGGLAFEPGPAFSSGDGVRLIVQGQILSGQSVRSTTSTRTQYGTLVPVGANYQESRGSETFVHFYGATPSVAVEIRPQGFNFRFLGAEAGPTKAGALKALLGKLRSLWPAALLDDTLLHVPPANEESSATEIVDAGRLASVETERREGSNEGGVLKASRLLAIAALRPDFS